MWSENISLNFKIWVFDSVYFDIGELVTSKLKKKALGWKLYLNTYMHAAKLEL